MRPPGLRTIDWSGVVFLLAALGCAGKSPGELMTPAACQAAVVAEKERAAGDGREPKPVVQRGQLATNIFDPENRAHITFDLAKDVPDNKLVVVARIFVRADGGVSDVQVEESSGVKPFDDAVVAKMKTWKHRPKKVDCAPVPYDYPMKYAHEFNN
jgi:TonB family protein